MSVISGHICLGLIIFWLISTLVVLLKLLQKPLGNPESVLQQYDDIKKKNYYASLELLLRVCAHFW